MAGFLSGLMAAVVVVAGFAAVFGGLLWLAARVRRRGIGGEIMGPFEEIWHPNAHHYRFEIRAQEERMVAIPSPGDKPTPGHGQVGAG